MLHMLDPGQGLRASGRARQGEQLKLQHAGSLLTIDSIGEQLIQLFSETQLTDLTEGRRSQQLLPPFPDMTVYS